MNHKYLPLSEPSCYIILSIYDKPKHGYAIVQDIKRMSSGTLSISNGTLYGILKRMEDDHLVETKIFENRKVYHITKLGTDILCQEYQRIKKIMQNFNQINFKSEERQ